jgi:hypothetical protein
VSYFYSLFDIVMKSTVSGDPTCCLLMSTARKEDHHGGITMTVGGYEVEVGNCAVRQPDPIVYHTLGSVSLEKTLKCIRNLFSVFLSHHSHSRCTYRWMMFRGAYTIFVEKNK